MAYRVDSRANTAADALREAMGRAERQIIQPNRENIESLLLTFDQIEQMVNGFSEGDIDLRSELARWEALQNRIRNNPGVIARAARAVGGLQQLRAKHPPASGMWWRADELHATQTRQTLQRTLLTLVTIVVVLVGGWQLVNFFFPPDPTAVVMLETSNRIEDAISKDDLPLARQYVDETLQTNPDAPEMLIWSIVLAEKMNDTVRATSDLEHSKEVFADQLPEFWVMLGNQRFQLGDLEGAEAAANEAIAINDREPQIYLLLASIAETRGQVDVAIRYFEQTYELSDSNPQLQVVARYRMGQLMQQAPMLNPSTPLTETTSITP